MLLSSDLYIQPWAEASKKAVYPWRSGVRSLVMPKTRAKPTGDTSKVSEVVARVIERVRNMTPKQRVKTLVDAGIIHSDGRLTAGYK